MTQKDLNPLSFAEMWGSGLSSSASRADHFLKEWADSGLIKALPSFQDYKNISFPMFKVSESKHQQLMEQVESILGTELTKSGPHRRASWQSGWAENLRKFGASSNSLALIPGYFEKSEYVRFENAWWEIADSSAEPTYLGYIVDTVIQGLQKELSFSDIHEFGCGTGIHVARLAQGFSDMQLSGYDWAPASVELLSAFGDRSGLNNISAGQFDFFEPDDSVAVTQDSLVLTVAALEQVGDKFMPFLKFLKSKNPKIIVNIEPMEELLDLDTQLGKGSAEYFRKRNYLSGFYATLVALESEGEVEIVHSGRTGFGSLFIEGYSCVIWRFV